MVYLGGTAWAHEGDTVSGYIAFVNFSSTILQQAIVGNEINLLKVLSKHNRILNKCIKPISQRQWVRNGIKYSFRSIGAVTAWKWNSSHNELLNAYILKGLCHGF